MCIQSSGGFIQEQHLGFNDELHPNVGPLSLTTRHSTNELSANLNGQKVSEQLFMYTCFHTGQSLHSYYQQHDSKNNGLAVVIIMLAITSCCKSYPSVCVCVFAANIYRYLCSHTG